MTTEADSIVNEELGEETEETDETEATASPVVTDRFAPVRDKIAEISAEVEDINGSLAELEGDMGQKKARATKGYGRLVAQRDGLQSKLDALTKQIENANKTEAQKTLTGPIIEMFGTLTVETTEGLPSSIAFADLKVKFHDKAAELRKRAASLVAVCDQLDAAVKAIVESEETQHDLRPFQIVAVDSKTVKIAVASGRASSGGTGKRRGGRAPQRILTLAEKYDQSLVGKIVGKGGDFENWTDFVEKTDPVLKASYGEQSRSYSQVAQQKMGVTAETVTVEAAA